MGAEDSWDKLQTNCKIRNFEGSSIWLKQALERENQLQKYLSVCYLHLVNKVFADKFDEI